MKPALLLVCLFWGLCAGAQTYPVGKRTLVFIDNSRSNRSISTDLFYPGMTAGNNVPVAGGTAKFPVVVFGHGFLMPVTAYQWLADSLVKYGFIVAFPSTESTISPNHDQFGRDIAFLCQRITSLNDSASSFLVGRVLDKSAAAGHSMGGGASFLAMTHASSITALFNFAAAETTPSAKAAALTVQRPSLIFSGSADCIVAPSIQLEMYTNIPYTCKSYINITGGLHCHFGNNDAICVLGQISSGCNSSSITVNDVFQKTMYLVVPFLKYYLQGDCAAGNSFQDNYNNITGVARQRSCTADPYGCLVTGTGNAPGANGIHILNNAAPAGEPVIIRSDREAIKSVVVFDVSGRLTGEIRSFTSVLVSINMTKRGIYLLKILSGKKIYTRKAVRW